MPVNNAPARLNTAQGAAPSYAARAWVNFNGTGTVAIRASGNVSSITDNNTADYSVNFTTPMPDANYTMVGSANQQGSTFVYMVMDRNPSAAAPRSTSAIRIFVGAHSSSTTTGSDVEQVNVAIFR